MTDTDRFSDLVDMLALVPHVETRGEGKAMFIYEHTERRAVEVSLDRSKFWVEYWDSLEDDASSKKDQTFNTLESAELVLRSSQQAVYC